MSKYSKALLEDKNAVFEWEIISITKSNKIGRSLNGPEVMRSRLFWMRLPNGKNWIFYHFDDRLMIVDAVKIYRINKIIKWSFSLIGSDPNCKARLSMTFNEKIICEKDRFSPNNTLDELNNAANYK